jgi:hypothetical protein
VVVAQPVVAGGSWSGWGGLGQRGVGLGRGFACELSVGSVVVVEVGEVVEGLGILRLLTRLWSRAWASARRWTQHVQRQMAKREGLRRQRIERRRM